MRSFLADLVYSNVLRRGAIRCSLLSTVVEIARMFTSRHIPVDSPLLATFQLYWHDGTGWQVFTAFEIPTMPAGSFVHIAQRSTACTSRVLTAAPDPWLLNMILEEEQNETAAPDHLAMMQSRAVKAEDELLRGAVDPLFRVVQRIRHHLPLRRRASLTVHLWFFEDDQVTTLPEARSLILQGDAHDWTNSAGLEGALAIMPILPKPPSFDPGVFQLMAFTNDASRHLLVDVLLGRRVVREAVQCRTEMSVLDIYRMIATGKFAMWYLQTTSLKLTWKPPEGEVTYRSHEVPTVPSGSYVTMQIAGEECTDDSWLTSHGLHGSRERQAGGNTATPVADLAEGRGSQDSPHIASFPDLVEDTAWPDFDEHSFMQLSADETSTIRWAQVVHAFHNRRSLNDVLSYSAQNFVRKDDLRHWVLGLLQPPNDMPVQLAIWRLGPWSMIARSCDYLRMEDDNWSRHVREYWKAKPDYKVPDMAAPEPQPLANSGADMRQLHVIAFEHNRMPIDTYMHLFEVWTTRNPAEGTGRVFLARMAAAIPRHFKVIQIVEALGLAHLLPPEGQCFILFSLRDGLQEAVYRKHHVPEVPEFSLLQIVLVQTQQAGCEPTIGDNTATPSIEELSQQDTVTTFLQLSMQMNFRNQFDKQIAEMLSPPGNPGMEFWNSVDLTDLDDWICIDEHVFVVDAKFTRARQVVSLADSLPVSGQEGPNVRLNGSRGVDPQRRVQLPDFRPLLDSIYCKQPEHDFDVTTLYEDLPEIVRKAAWAVELGYKGPCHSLHIYTDGSFSAKAKGSLALLKVQRSAWSILILVLWTQTL